MKEFFPTIPYVKYEGIDSKNPMSFRYYNPDEVILGKPMKDQLKFAMSYWHTMCADGTDMFGCGTNVKTYGETDPMELAKAKAHAAFEFMNKLSIDCGSTTTKPALYEPDEDDEKTEEKSEEKQD